jgi:hypothetical protein
VPGPGAYGFGVEMNKTGNYPLSTYENSRAANWSPSKKRFIDETRPTRDLPGPGHYNPSDTCSNGMYLLSNFKNYGTKKFKLETKKGQTCKMETPGPGTYMPPSEFGYLELYKNSPRTA